MRGIVALALFEPLTEIRLQKIKVPQVQMAVRRLLSFGGLEGEGTTSHDPE